MSDDKHTPEPWSAKDYRICASVDDPKNFSYVLDTASSKATRTPRNAVNAERICACVNALAGIDDPAALKQFFEDAKRCAICTLDSLEVNGGWPEEAKTHPDGIGAAARRVQLFLAAKESR